MVLISVTLAAVSTGSTTFDQITILLATAIGTLFALVFFVRVAFFTRDYLQQRQAGKQQWQPSSQPLANDTSWAIHSSPWTVRANSMSNVDRASTNGMAQAIPAVKAVSASAGIQEQASSPGDTNRSGEGQYTQDSLQKEHQVAADSTLEALLRQAQMGLFILLQREDEKSTIEPA